MVELDALEKRCAGNGTEGSNPSLSAKLRTAFLAVFNLGVNDYSNPIG